MVRSVTAQAGAGLETCRPETARRAGVLSVFQSSEYKSEDGCSIHKSEKPGRGWITKGLVSHIN